MCSPLGLKSKSVAGLIKEIVREQFKVFQSDMQETVAQVFKMASGLSEDLESTKELVKRLNASHQKLATEMEAKPAKLEVLEIRSQILHIEEEISFSCERPIKDLQEKQRSMGIALEHQSSRSNIYYESLNKTLTQMKEVHEQLLSAERISEQNIPTSGKSVDDNITDYVIGLHERVKTQNLLVLQLYDDLRVQDSKISNLTVELEIQRDYLEGVCDEKLSECRADFRTQLRSIEEDMHSLNRTLESLVFPLDDKIDKMNEQINDLCYDMEILQPLIEHGVPFSLTSEDEQQIETEAMSRKLENLTSVVSGLSSSVELLTKNQKVLKNEAQVHGEISERRINECFVLMEDGLNKTLMVVNSAIDSIQDNYVLKESLNAFRNDPEGCCAGAKKIESVLTLIPQFHQMNESLQAILSENQKHGTTSKISWSSAPASGEHGIPHLSRVQLDHNTTFDQHGHQEARSDLETNQLHPIQEHKDYEVRLQAVESRISKFLANNCASVRNVKAVLTEGEKVVSSRLQILDSRIRALEGKSIRLSLTVPLLNKTAYEARSLCRDVSGRVQEVNASIPRLMKASYQDRLLFQKGFQELMESVLEVRTGVILSNLTLYVDKSIADAEEVITKRLKATPQAAKKPLPPKKMPGGTTINQAGRSQRNTDSTLEAGTAFQD